MTIWKPNIEDIKEPKYLAIASSLEKDIREGDLTPGQLLPTHRELADALGVTVGTISRAYAESERRGLTRGETGRGTFVTQDVKANGYHQLHEDISPGFIDLSLACATFDEDEYIRSTLQELSRSPNIGRLMEYQPSHGIMRHRKAGVKWMSRYGIRVAEDNILVTSGAQHALTVILSTLCKPGDRILTEALTYPIFKKLAAQLQLRLVPVAMDEEGLIPEDLDAACSKNNVSVLYTIPTIHNPTNACLSEERRASISRIAQNRDLWIIEDDCYALAMPNRPIPLFNLAPERTCFIAGISKFLGGGLRVGFLAAPRQIVGDLSMAITNTTWMASPLTAEIVTKWIEDGKADSIIKIRRKTAEERNNIAAECLKGFDYQGYQNSYFIWLTLPEPWSGEDFEREVLNRGIGLAAAERFIVGQTPLPRAVRVSLFGPRNPAHLQRGLTTITDTLHGIPGTPREFI